ncbi:MAG: nuclear transport factor 2 family protein [Capsulimonadales bacterium]|nr:nuclear transport factor 2 family protein [Capsulimonadales bacterium]
MSDTSILPIETGAVNEPNVRKIRDYQKAMAEGRFAEAATIFDADVRYVVPGNNPLSGDYAGAEAVMGYFGRLMELTGGTYAITQMNWLVCGDDVLLETRNTARIGANELTWDEAILFRFVAGRKKVIELFQADQAAVDRFFQAAGPGVAAPDDK